MKKLLFLVMYLISSIYINAAVIQQSPDIPSFNYDKKILALSVGCKISSSAMPNTHIRMIHFFNKRLSLEYGGGVGNAGYQFLSRLFYQFKLPSLTTLFRLKLRSNTKEIIGLGLSYDFGGQHLQCIVDDQITPSFSNPCAGYVPYGSAYTIQTKPYTAFHFVYGYIVNYDKFFLRALIGYYFRQGGDFYDVIEGTIPAADVHSFQKRFGSAPLIEWTAGFLF